MLGKKLVARVHPWHAPGADVHHLGGRQGARCLYGLDRAVPGPG